MSDAGSAGSDGSDDAATGTGIAQARRPATRTLPG